MKRSDLIELGFKDLPHFTIGNSIHYELTRGRYISISCLGSPNEMVFLCKKDDENPKKVTDLIVVSNFDYDGLVSIDTIKRLINIFK